MPMPRSPSQANRLTQVEKAAHWQAANAPGQGPQARLHFGPQPFLRFDAVIYVNTYITSYASVPIERVVRLLVLAWPTRTPRSRQLPNVGMILNGRLDLTAAAMSLVVASLISVGNRLWVNEDA